MFWRKARRIKELEHNLDEQTRDYTRVQLDVQEVNKKLAKAEAARLDLAAKGENLKEQLARALDERGRVTEDHAVLSQELQKTQDKLREAQEELREARQEAQRLAAKLESGNAIDGETWARDPHAHGPVKFNSEDDMHELENDTPEYAPDKKSSA